MNANSPLEQGQNKGTQSGRSLWDKAYDVLRKDNEGLVDAFERILLSETGMESSSSLVHKDSMEREKQMSVLVAKKLAVMEEKQWKIKTLSKEPMMVREKVDRIIKVVLVAKDFGSSLASMDPIHAGLPWAGVCMLLPVRQITLLTYDQIN